MSNTVTVKTSRKGIGFMGALVLIFIVLKLTGVISWSWWLVFMPLLLLPSIIGLIFIIGFIFLAVAVSNNN